MNNFIVSGKGFLKSVKHNKENNQLMFEFSEQVRDSCKYRTSKDAWNIIEKHKLDAFVWNPYKEEHITGKWRIYQRDSYIDYNDETKHKILEWIPDRLVMEKKTDVNFLSSKGIDTRIYYDSYEDAIIVCRVKNMEIINELIDKMNKMDDTINKNKNNKHLNKNEAPDGYYAIIKDNCHFPNVCEVCDARKLCIDNKDNWNLHNSCIGNEKRTFLERGFGIRMDGCSVVFKLKNKE